MASILLITASPYGLTSRGTLIARDAIASLRAKHPLLTLVERDLSTISAVTVQSSYADAILGRHAYEVEAFAFSETLIREVEEAEFVIIATPMHNYTVPAALKLWIDMLLRYGRSFAPVDGVKTGLLADRPTLIVVSSGGQVTGAGSLQPDHLTSYMTDVLTTVGIRDIRFVYLEGLANQNLVETAILRGARIVALDTVFGDPLQQDVIVTG